MNDKQNGTYPYKGILFNLNKGYSSGIWYNMDANLNTFMLGEISQTHKGLISSDSTYTTYLE